MEDGEDTAMGFQIAIATRKVGINAIIITMEQIVPRGVPVVMSTRNNQQHELESRYVCLVIDRISTINVTKRIRINLVISYHDQPL